MRLFATQVKLLNELYDELHLWCLYYVSCDFSRFSKLVTYMKSTSRSQQIWLQDMRFAFSSRVKLIYYNKSEAAEFVPSLYRCVVSSTMMCVVCVRYSAGSVGRRRARTAASAASTLSQTGTPVRRARSDR